MIDFHVEVSLKGNGYLPAEAIHFFSSSSSSSGFRAIGLILRVDAIHYIQDFALLKETVKMYSLYSNIETFLGVKFVHVPSALLPDMVASARELGATLVLVEGEGSSLYPQHIQVGTNFAAIQSGVDILASPGLLSYEDAAFAVEKNVYIELTGSAPAGFFNGYLTKMANLFGFNLLISCDFSKEHTLFAPEHTKSFWYGIGLGSGLDKKQMEHVEATSRALVQKFLLQNRLFVLYRFWSLYKKGYCNGSYRYY